MPTLYNGQLRANEVFTSIFNMIINQRVFSDNIAGTFSKLIGKNLIVYQLNVE